MIKTIKLVCRELKDNLNAICKTTGKNRFLTAVDMLWCVVFRLVLPSEYYSFGFDIIPRSKRKDYATQHRRQKITRALNKTASLNVLCNKYYFSRIFTDFLGRDCLHTLGLNMSQFQAFIERNPKFIYKPIDGHGGHGHIVYHLNNTDSPEAIYEKIIALPRGVLEGWIIQHEALNALYSNAVHIARIHTIHDGSGKDILIYGANLSIAFKGEIANTSLDTSLSALVDDLTGIITTDGYDIDFNIFKEIPGSGITIRGFQLPDWDKAIDMVKRAAAIIPELGYIGWDVAFTPDGPVLVEGNISPDNGDIQTRCLVQEGLSGGVWPLLKSYLKK